MSPPPPALDLTAAQVLAFWREAGPRKWFSKDAAFDAEIRKRFEAPHFAAARRELDGWADTAEGALALLILLDQFPRNMYRGTAHAFATDPLARTIARALVASGGDRTLADDVRFFAYLPFEHSEDTADQAECLRLVEAWIAEGGDPDNRRWVKIHNDIIARFGRFPHRNPALGRVSTPQELAFLAEGGFSG
jgi:uncharacterized protein (DUF924 family)